jgi:hypothetical protein
LSQIDYLKKYDRIMFTALGQLYTRILGQNALHVPIEEIYAYWTQILNQRPQEIEGIDVKLDTPRLLLFQVKKYKLGEGLDMDFWVWGLRKGRNTVFTRIGWWKMRIIERAMGAVGGKWIGVK